MPTDSIPEEASSTNTPKQTVADKYRDAQVALKKERRLFFYWMAFLVFAILNFGMRVFLVTAKALAATSYDLWDKFWVIFAVLLVPFAVWIYGSQLIDYSRSKQRLSLAEAAALKEAAKSTAEQ
jgi:hypothetical protein